MADLYLYHQHNQGLCHLRTIISICSSFKNGIQCEVSVVRTLHQKKNTVINIANAWMNHEYRMYTMYLNSLWTHILLQFLCD